MVQKIFEILSKHKFSLDTEDLLKQQMAQVFTQHDISFKKEYSFDPKNRVDFLVEDIAIEVKIRSATSMQIYRQCKRYCELDGVGSLVLVTNKSMGFPKEINGKPCYVINLGRSWL